MQSTFYNANKSVDLFIWCAGKTKEFCVKSYVFFIVFFILSVRPIWVEYVLDLFFFFMWNFYPNYSERPNHTLKRTLMAWIETVEQIINTDVSISMMKGLHTTKNETIDFNVLISNEKGRETDRWITVASVCLNRIWYLKMRSHVNGQHNGDQ